LAKLPKQAAVIVAHPDDETLWAGGAILTSGNYSWTIIAMCRGGDRDRAPRFRSALRRLHAQGVMADLDDGPEQEPLDIARIEKTILSLLPRPRYDLLVTHSPFGEYTRHRRHEETSRAVTNLWNTGRLTAPELWLFAYEDGEKGYLPRPIGRAHLQVELDDDVWQTKLDIICSTYGFETGSWEARTTPRAEAFWCFRDVSEYQTWLEQEPLNRRGKPR
jgi:LmbE family N-acetylglucosaminyl deacetylase